MGRPQENCKVPMTQKIVKNDEDEGMHDNKVAGEDGGK